MSVASDVTAMEERVRQVASLWRAVTSRPIHPVGCTCMGHFLIPAMNAADMEADILDYMRGRYAADRLDDLVALLDTRAAERASETPAASFRAWLLRLPQTLASAALDRFLLDLTATLDSLKANSRTSGSGSGLICT
jgi:hypothetical protein